MTNVFDQALQKATGGYAVETLIVTRKRGWRTRSVDGSSRCRQSAAQSLNKTRRAASLFRIEQLTTAFLAPLLELIAKMRVWPTTNGKSFKVIWVGRQRRPGRALNIFSIPEFFSERARRLRSSFTICFTTIRNFLQSRRSPSYHSLLDRR